VNKVLLIPKRAAATPQRRRFLLSAVGVAASGALLGCGGGDSDEPPTIELAAIPTSGAVGATITLSANAEDDNSLKEVRFFRVTNTAEELLATFTRGPYLLQTTIPTGATGSVTYRATAIDDDDQETDSNTVSITVTT
jgi:Bacterial Ig domain